MSDMAAAIAAIDEKATANTRELISARNRLSEARKEVARWEALLEIHTNLAAEYDAALKALRDASEIGPTS